MWRVVFCRRTNRPRAITRARWESLVPPQFDRVHCLRAPPSFSSRLSTALCLYLVGNVPGAGQDRRVFILGALPELSGSTSESGIPISSQVESIRRQAKARCARKLSPSWPLPGRHSPRLSTRPPRQRTSMSPRPPQRA